MLKFFVAALLLGPPVSGLAAFGQVISPIPAKPSAVPFTPEEGEEDLSTLSGANSMLTAAAPIPGETTETPEYTRELLRVQWRGGDPIDLYVVKPKGVKRPPAIIYLYSYPSETERFRSDAWCRNVVRGGFAAVGFVSALTGHRYHDVPMKQWFVSELATVLPMTVHDVQMIVNYLASRGDIDTNRLGMFGQGSGGTIAILAASAVPELRAVDVMDPWGDWPDWLAGSPQIPEGERAEYLKPEFLKSVSPLDPLVFKQVLNGPHFRMQEALFNTAIPDKVRAKFDQAVPQTQRVTYTSPEDYAERASKNTAVTAWLREQLSSVGTSPKT